MVCTRAAKETWRDVGIWMARGLRPSRPTALRRCNTTTLGRWAAEYAQPASPHSGRIPRCLIERNNNEAVLELSRAPKQYHLAVDHFSPATGQDVGFLDAPAVWMALHHLSGCFFFYLPQTPPMHGRDWHGTKLNDRRAPPGGGGWGVYVCVCWCIRTMSNQVSRSVVRKA